MAFFINKDYLKKDFDFIDEKFWKNLYSPGQEVKVSGIYICTECQKEITSNKGDPFPPPNIYHDHDKIDIKWKLIVRTNTNGE